MSKTNKELAELCRSIASNAADEHNFVSTEKLLEIFRSEIIMRPLLVEGMIASTDDSETPWAILVDSDRYGTNYSDTYDSPAGKRLRNTIAHELAHSLSFRSEELKLSFTRPKKTGQSNSDFVKDIEDETEAISPLLLISEPAILDLAKDLSLETLVEFREKHGISNHVLINRLNLLKESADFTVMESMLNKSVAIHKKGTIEPWPFFRHYNGYVEPDFIKQVFGGSRIDLGSIISDSNFILNGGVSTSTKINMPSQGRIVGVSFTIEAGKNDGILIAQECEPHEQKDKPKQDLIDFFKNS